MTNSDIERWNSRYEIEGEEWLERQPRQLLRDFTHLLPRRGVALDAASGVANNSLLLAKYGLHVIVNPWMLAHIYTYGECVVHSHQASTSTGDTNMQNTPILITGKNGKTGSRVNQRLQVLGYATRAVSRSLARR